MDPKNNCTRGSALVPALLVAMMLSMAITFRKEIGDFMEMSAAFRASTGMQMPHAEEKS